MVSSEHGHLKLQVITALVSEQWLGHAQRQHVTAVLLTLRQDIQDPLPWRPLCLGRMDGLQVPFRKEHSGALQHYEIMRLHICCCELHKEEPLTKADS